MNLREKMTENYLLSKGCLVYTVIKPSYKGQQHDIFDLWDHLVFWPGEEPLILDGVIINSKELFLVQTKSRKLYGKDREKYSSFPYHHKFLFVWKEIIQGRKKLYDMSIEFLN